MRSIARVAATAALTIAGLGIAPGAGAQAKSADALFQEGLRLFEAGKVHEACARFEQSLGLDPALGTLQNLATCHEEEGRTARAHTEFVELAERAGKAGQRPREALGRQHAAALEKRLSKVTLHFGPDANVAEIRVDDTPLDPGSWRAPVALDPGPHALTFGAPGKRAAVQAIAVSPGPSSAEVLVPRLADEAPAPAAAAPGPDLRKLGLVVGGVGLGVVALGGIFGGVTFAKKAAGNAHCVGMYCDPEGLSLEGAAHGFATLSSVSFALGLAALGVGTGLFVWSGKKGATAPGVVRVGPTASATVGGAEVAGEW